MGQLGTTLFGDGGAGAAGRAAMAQKGEAERQFGLLESRTEKPTLEAMLNFETGIKAQERQLSRQEQLISQIDPTVIEASQQALRLLRGESAASLGPLQRQRDQQRQKLVNMLREQLGPGAETSTAGIQALTRFDSETDSLMAGAQQQALQGLGNVGSQFNSMRPDILREAGGLGQLGGARAGLATDRAKLLYGAGQDLVSNAGAPWVEEALRGQQNSAFGRMLLGGAVGAVSGGLGNAVTGGMNALGSGIKGLFAGSPSSGNAPGAANFGGFGNELIPSMTGQRTYDMGRTA